MKFLPAFNDMFDDLFHDPFDYSSVDSMRTDIVEKDDQYMLNMELPGYKKEDIQLELKDGYLPTIQLKKNRRFVETEYVASSNGDVVAICLTNVDYELFLKHYNVYNLEYIRGWKFRASKDLFKKQK